MEFYDKREYRYESVNMKDVPPEKSQIQTYYHDKTILVTGATGFLGTLLIEKLLRNCADIKLLILIVRPKAGQTSQHRINEFFNDEVFHRLRTAKDNYALKLKVLAGNCEQPNLGLQEDVETKRLLESVDIVFHLAGNVQLDDSLRDAYRSNILTLKNALEMMPQMSSLKAFVCVSTIYSDSGSEMLWFTEEKFQQYLKINDKTMSCFLSKFMKDTPNTFILSKSIGEILAINYICRYPVIICRLPFVTPTIEEPLTCWTKHLTGMSDILTGIGSGFLRTFLCDRDILTDIIPADRAINGLISLPIHFQRTVNQTAGSYNPIYNFIAVPNDSLTWLNTVHKLKVAQFEKFTKCCARSIVTKCPAAWLGKHYFLHLLPVLLMAIVKGRNEEVTSLWKEYANWIVKTKKYSFLTLDRYSCSDKSTTNTQDLIKTVSFEDSIMFNCDIGLNLEDYFFRLTKFFNNYIEQFHLDAYKIKHQSKLLRLMESTVTWTIRGFLLWCVYRIYLKYLEKYVST